MTRTVVATDDFNRANGGLGSNWTSLHPFWGSPSIAGNKCEVGGTLSSGGSAARWNGAGTFTDDQYAKATIGAFTWAGDANGAGVAVRCSGETDGNRDYYSFYVVGPLRCRRASLSSATGR